MVCNSEGTRLSVVDVEHHSLLSIVLRPQSGRTWHFDPMSNLQVPTTHDDELPLAGVLPSPPLDSMPALFCWYSKYLCNAELRDPRGFRVCFEPNAFVHLAKITDKYGREPKNKQLAIGQMQRGRFPLIHGKTPNYDPERVRNLAFAAALTQKPDFIVKNWQAQGSAYPGEVYVRDFGTSGRRKYRILICKINGLKRVPVTAFAKQSIMHMESFVRLWP